MPDTIHLLTEDHRIEKFDKEAILRKLTTADLGMELWRRCDRVYTVGPEDHYHIETTACEVQDNEWHAGNALILVVE